jgi:hypothetical protein
MTSVIRLREERSDAAIQRQGARRLPDCFASLAMTVIGLPR